MHVYAQVYMLILCGVDGTFKYNHATDYVINIPRPSTNPSPKELASLSLPSQLHRYVHVHVPLNRVSLQHGRLQPKYLYLITRTHMLLESLHTHCKSCSCTTLLYGYLLTSVLIEVYDHDCLSSPAPDKVIQGLGTCTLHNRLTSPSTCVQMQLYA